MRRISGVIPEEASSEIAGVIPEEILGRFPGNKILEDFLMESFEELPIQSIISCRNLCINYRRKPWRKPLISSLRNFMRILFLIDFWMNLWRNQC